MSWMVSKWENAAYLCFLKIHRQGLKGQPCCQSLLPPRLPAHTHTPPEPQWPNTSRHCILIPLTAPVLTAHCTSCTLKKGKSSMTNISTQVPFFIWEKQSVSSGEQNIRILVNEKGKSWTKTRNHRQICFWTDRNKKLWIKACVL